MAADRGERIKLALKMRGIRKQHALAVELRVHESAITRWKEGKAMSLESAIALSRALDLSLDWLLLGRGDMKSSALDSETLRLQALARRLGPEAIDLIHRLVDLLSIHES